LRSDPYDSTDDNICIPSKGPANAGQHLKKSSHTKSPNNTDSDMKKRQMQRMNDIGAKLINPNASKQRIQNNDDSDEQNEEYASHRGVQSFVSSPNALQQQQNQTQQQQQQPQSSANKPASNTMVKTTLSIPSHSSSAHLSENERDYFAKLAQVLDNRLANSAKSTAYNASQPDSHANSEINPHQFAFGSSIGAFPSAFHHDASIAANGSAPITDILSVQKELRERKAQIALLTSQYEHIGITFKAEKEIQKQAVQQCQEYKQLLNESRRKIAELERELKRLESDKDEIAQLRVMLKEEQTEKQMLEERVQVLSQNIFSGDSLEKARIKKLSSEFNEKEHILKTDAENQEKKYLEMKKLLQAKSQSLEVKTQEYEILQEKFKSNKDELRAALSQIQELSDQLSTLSGDTGVDMGDLRKALDLVRRQRDQPASIPFRTFSTKIGATSDGSEELHRGISFGEPAATEIQAVETEPQMRRRLHDQDIKIRELLTELNKEQDLRLVQVRLNKDLKDQLDKEKKENLQTKNLLEQFKLDIQRGNAMGSNGSNGVAGLENDCILFDIDDTDSLNGDMHNSNSIRNMFAYKVASCSLNENASVFKSSNGSNVMTFLTADFFDFETAQSNPFGGLKPVYNFAAQYKLDADEFFQRYLLTDVLLFELHKYFGGSRSERIATCRISLRDLVGKTSKIDTRAKFVDGDGNTIGEAHVMIQLLRPIMSVHNTPLASSNSNVSSNIMNSLSSFSLNGNSDSMQ
jgi:hypothetical protein